MNQGVVRSIKDLVVTVVFDDEMPDIHEVLLVEGNDAPLLVESLLRGNRAMCLNIQSDRSLQKGMSVKRTGHSIEIPVGEALIGRVVDTLGNPLDGQPPIDESLVERRNIFTVPARGDGFGAVAPEILETGIKVIDFFTPFVKGRKIGIVGGAGVGKTVLTMELIHNIAEAALASASSPVSVSVFVKATNCTKH